MCTVMVTIQWPVSKEAATGTVHTLGKAIYTCLLEEGKQQPVKLQETASAHHWQA